MHNLPMAKWHAAQFADYLTENEGRPEIFDYPQTDRVVTETGQTFYDS